MQISQQRLAYLQEVYSSGKASDDEINEWLDWVQTSEDPADPAPSSRPLPAERLPVRRISWLHATAAALILLITSTVFLYKCNNKHFRMVRGLRESVSKQTLNSSNKV